MPRKATRMSEYSEFSRGKLQLKGLPEKKKKKRQKEKELVEKVKDELANGSTDKVEIETESQLTKAELAFLKKSEERRMKIAIQNSHKTHKQKVEEFNQKLDNMSEHYDIPKVSWTK